MLAMLAFAALAADPADWQKAESAHLHNVKQVTRDFVRAGEGYFSPDGKTIIFQAEEKDTGNPFYQIFTMDLASGRTQPRQPRTRQMYLCLLLARRQEDHLLQQPSRPGRQVQAGSGVPEARGGPQGRRAAPVQVGL